MWTFVKSGYLYCSAQRQVGNPGLRKVLNGGVVTTDSGSYSLLAENSVATVVFQTEPVQIGLKTWGFKSPLRCHKNLLSHLTLQGREFVMEGGD